MKTWLDELKWANNGLIPAVAQDKESGNVLMLAWMNREALQATVNEKRAVYWSRSRQQLWRKGEESGNVQKLHELRVDCDKDAILLIVDQIGGIACHTGRATCFYHNANDSTLEILEPIIKNPEDLYGTD